MKKTYAPLLLCLLSLASCTITDNEQQGLDEVEKVYGGKVSFKIGTFTSTNPKAAQGKLLEIDLTDADLTRYGNNMAFPAANAAMLMYNRMTTAERADYNGLQVVLQQGNSRRTFSYPMPLLADAARAYHQLKIVLDGWQKQDYQLVADRWNDIALTRPDRTGLPAAVAHQGAKIGPIASFFPEGFMDASTQVDGRREQLINVYVTIAAPGGGTQQMVFSLNPKLPDNGQFLYGLEFLKPPFVSK